VTGAGGGAERKLRPRRLAAGLRSFWSVPTYRFATLFLAVLAGLSAIYPALRLRFGHTFAALERFTAEVVYHLLDLFSSEVELEGRNVVLFGGFPVAIIDECSGVYEAVLLGAALLAFPTTWGRIALGFLIGVPLIYAMNLARIALLLVVGRHYPHLFEFMHVYFWQVTMIAMVASTWLLWVRWAVRGSEAPRATRLAGPGGWGATNDRR
jgi:exosortase H (IPTLxxWG-CTERM-specific)